MSQHTPGPWWVGDDDGYIYDEGNGIVATVMDDANARLIAAAPETAAERDRLKVVNAMLLEALEGVDEWHDLIKQNYPEMFRAFKEARAAIRAAKGESNG